jgi:hypothetical protein
MAAESDAKSHFYRGCTTQFAVAGDESPGHVAAPSWHAASLKSGNVAQGSADQLTLVKSHF